MCISVIFFFKQKTAYEMRISDWSSDVCSSDLPGQHDEIVERRVDHQRLDDVAGDQKFQAEQDAAAERRAERAIGLGSVARPRPPRKQKGCSSGERRVGTECVSTCRSRWSTYH